MTDLTPEAPESDFDTIPHKEDADVEGDTVDPVIDAEQED